MNYIARKNTELHQSGLDWVRNIPIAWSLRPAKYVMRASDERLKDHPDFDTALSVSGYRGVVPRNVTTNDGQLVSEDPGNYRVVKKNQLVVNTMWLNFAGLGVSDYNGFVSPAYQSYYLGTDIDSRFAHYLLRDTTYVQKYTSLLYGVRPNSMQVKRHDFERLSVLLPPPAEQHLISSFLDEKMNVVGEIIEKRRKQIQLLKEKRAAIITEAVTKGLDPDIEMVDSGIEWHGRIPRGWEVKKLGHIGQFYKGGTLSKSELSEEGEPVLLYGDIYTKFDIQTETMDKFAPKEVAKMGTLIHSDDLLFTGSGETAEDIGKCIVYTGSERAYAGGDVIIFRQKAANSLFLSYQQSSHLHRAEKARYAKGHIVVHIYPSQLKQLPMLLPPIEGQERIVSHLNKVTSIIDTAIEKLSRSIELLQEYRTSLISSAVTGKIAITN